MNLWVRIADLSGLGRGTVLVLTGIAALLVLGTLARGLRWRARPDDAKVRERLGSVAAWWVFFLVLVTALLLGRAVLVVILVALTLALLRDTLRLAQGIRWYVVAATLGTVGPLAAAGVVLLPPPSNPPDTSLGWFVLLAVLTELNDSAQAWWGRALGAHHMTPKLSPHKTWEGLVGGVATTACVAGVIAPLLTPYGRELPLGGAAPGPVWAWSIGLGVVLGLGGAAGDLLGSLLKRHAGVKDSGDLIPGQGGVLDRFDSLTVTAPLFLILTWFLWMPGP
jgi:phosphatidate cytidylyltransferase